MSLLNRGLQIAVGGLIGACVFGGGAVLLQLASGNELDLAKISSMAVAGAIVVGILVGAGRPGRTR